MGNKSRKIGEIGEKAAGLYLKQNGFKIIDSNYQRPWGEIDLVATRDNIWYFCEVKTIVSNPGIGNDEREPAELLTRQKMKRLKRVIDSYLEDEGVDSESEWQVVAVLVTLSPDLKSSQIDWLDDVF